MINIILFSIIFNINNKNYVICGFVYTLNVREDTQDMDGSTYILYNDSMRNRRRRNIETVRTVISVIQKNVKAHKILLLPLHPTVNQLLFISTLPTATITIPSSLLTTTTLRDRFYNEKT